MIGFPLSLLIQWRPLFDRVTSLATNQNSCHVAGQTDFGVASSGISSATEMSVNQELASLVHRLESVATRLEKASGGSGAAKTIVAGKTH